MLVAVAGWQGWAKVKQSGADWLPVKHIKIEGTFQYIAKNRIRQAMDGHISKGFYNASVQSIQLSVKTLPWVASVWVERVWPDTIILKITEQAPVARWKGNSLINEVGEIFKPQEISSFGFLPLLNGPEGHEMRMLESINVMSENLVKQGMMLAEFHINERRAWQIKLQNEMVLNAGRNQPLSKIQRFLNTIDLITKEQIDKISVVDLRYSNGYALKWKQGEAETDWKKIAEMSKI